MGALRGSDEAQSPSPSSSTSGSTKGKGRELHNDDDDDGGVDTGETGEENEEDTIEIATVSDASIVGFQGARGVATLKKGQPLELRRDHVNVHDKNAIEVRHANRGAKVGMLSRTYAARLAPLFDSREIETSCFAGAVPASTVGFSKLPLSIVILGSRALSRDSRLDWAFPERMQLLAEKKAKLELEKKTAAMGRKLSTGGSDGSPRAGSEADVLMAESILIERGDRPSGDVLGELYKEGGMDPALLPIHPRPPGKKDKTMRTDLMTFQKQGLAWMIKMEHPELPTTVDDPPVQLWQMKKDTQGEVFWYNVATETSQRNKPILKRGGILADEMGLGKTVQTIALICTDDTGDGVTAKPEEPDERYDDMTLIVCPLSVASNWTDQFHRHVGSKRLTWHLYHGEGRKVSKKQLRKFDVVITTYQTLVQEHAVKDGEPPAKKAKLGDTKEKEGKLHAIKWRRVVLDEGHLIKNPKAKMSMSCVDLKAERRWILTGTPIVNSIKDLGAMMSFLKLCRPLDQGPEWQRYVLSALEGDPAEGAKLLRAIVSSTTLRRTKDMTDAKGVPLVHLPGVQFYLHRVRLAPDAQKLYNEIASEVEGMVQGILTKSERSVEVSSVLVWLLRLRQIACDPSLCPQSFINSVRNRSLMREANLAATLGPGVHQDEVQRLQRLMLQLKDSNTECSICFDSPVDPRITPCGHLFCSACIEEHIELDPRCPVDRRPITGHSLVAEDEVQMDETEVLERQMKEGLGSAATAAKTQQLLLLLRSTEPGIKSLVFSQWTSHLNLIQEALTQADIVSCRFDGSMTQQKREEMIAAFSDSRVKKLKKGEKGSPSVMLISLKAGALGLNLTCASQVFLMDPWWQASIEQQAIDRVNRIGQERSVKVFQMVAEGTVEDRVLQIQKDKEELISRAFSGNKNAVGKKEKIESRLQDIAKIFGVKLA